MAALPDIATTCSILARCSAGQGQALRVAAERRPAWTRPSAPCCSKLCGRDEKMLPAEPKDGPGRWPKGRPGLKRQKSFWQEMKARGVFTPYAPVVLTPAALGVTKSMMLRNNSRARHKCAMNSVLRSSFAKAQHFNRSTILELVSLPGTV